MTAGTRYYLIDGDGQTAASYQYTTPVDDGRGSVFNDPSIVWEFGLSYRFRPRAGRTSHRVGFNLKNAFDRYYAFNSMSGTRRNSKIEDPAHASSSSTRSRCPARAHPRAQ